MNPKNLFSVLLVVGCSLLPLQAEEVPMPGKILDGLISKDNLDLGGFAEWMDGQETVIQGEGAAFLPAWVVWTDETQPGHSGFAFGKSANAGPRHLRIGLVSALPVGTVIVKGGGRLSVLKLEAAYPGNLSNEDEWIPARRLVDGKISSAELGENDCAAWILPPGTTTQALRFTHEAAVTDARYECRLGGVLILADRFENVAPQAIASASSKNEAAAKLNNDVAEVWGSWENLEKGQAADDAPIVSAEQTEWVILAWPEPVNLRGLLTLFAGFGSANVQAYTGAADVHPRDAGEKDWKPIGDFDKLKNGYPVPLWPNWMGFPADVKTRAIRLRMTSATDEGHPHIQGNTLNGRRVWLAELMALSPLGNAPLKDASGASASAATSTLKPPIPVKFTLDEPGFVTLVIEKMEGQRVRNLISETQFPAGENTVWWDGTDDLGRDVDAARHGVYRIPSRLVEPGEYRVRGLKRSAIEPRYEFAVYNAGIPAWNTADKTGGWLSNHSPPQAAVFAPGGSPNGKSVIYLGSYVSEGRDGIAWVDLEGRKQGGKGWVGGNWTGAPYIAYDAGPNPNRDHLVYVGSAFSTGKGETMAELRLTAITKGEDKSILKMEFEPRDPKKMSAEIAGIAADNGVIVVSMPQRKELLFVDAAEGKVIGNAPLADTRGVAFDSMGKLYVVSGTKVLRYSDVKDLAKLPVPEVVIASGLVEPQQLTFDDRGNLYVSDWGDSHQVKVFAPKSANEFGMVRAIGNPGAPKAGPYDPLHMNHPQGITIDSNKHLWVAENDFLPKRVSVWTLEGELVKAFYGPSKYGGGGTLDSQDKNQLFYADEEHGAMAFKLDWEAGTSEPISVYYRPGPQDMKLGFRSAAPEVAFYRDGQRYFTNCYNSNPVAGHNTAFLFLERVGVAHPVAAMGRAADWPTLMGEDFRARWPAGIDPTSKDPEKSEASFSWTDSNDDGQVQPDEVTMQPGRAGGMTVMPDLSFVFARKDGRTMRYAPTGFSDKGVPTYDFTNGQILAEGVMGPASTGGNQALVAKDGWTIVTLGMAPFAQQSLSGTKDGKPMWSYPSVWPGLHAAHEAPKPDHPGELIGTTRLLGGFFEPKGSTAGPLWAVNGNLGTVYVFTADGLFVATLFVDCRIGKLWAMPSATRGMSLAETTLHEENFWPTISQTSDGNVYIVDGGRSSLVSLHGMETIRRLPDSAIKVTTEDLQKAQKYQTQVEIERQREQGRGTLNVAMLPVPPLMDGNVDAWKVSWADIDKAGVKANFNSDSKPYDVTGALAVAGNRLYVGYRTGNPKLLENSGEVPNALFKTGGALDLMIAANPAADPKRSEPAPGDLRLIVTLVGGKPRAVLYRAVVPNTPQNAKVPFSSPWRTITLDKVEDVTAQIQFGAKDGNYAFSIPLETLGIRPQPGLKLKGDIGVLRGDASITMSRTYWSNKATSIVSDVPSEAMLQPGLWGTLEFKPAK